MEYYFYLCILIILFTLAISDLIVGVANDAVNFVNSAVGSKAATMKMILIVASMGVFIGAIFSSGMMEIARKGLFHPQMFYFNEIMMIFLAVMLTDVVLLDTFNSFGLPTSTTVSLVFEILGAAVSMSILKISQNNESIIAIANYINSEKALGIITGIFLSVGIAFTIGLIVQWITRMLFTFRYERKLNYFAGIFGGLALTSILYFLLLKGLKDTTIISKSNYEFIDKNINYVLLGTFVVSAIIMQILHSIFKVNILKIIVLAGTFALAMAFAGNDLVNFIGVPIAGFKSFQIYSSQEGINPNNLLMTELAKPVPTEMYLLLMAGTIMVLTLWFSKKAKTVIQTSVQLSSQADYGKERFGSSYVGRIIVKGVIAFYESLKKFIPQKVKDFIASRYADKPIVKKKHITRGEKPAFDLLRASVNTIVASILIATGTSLKLPLSTTYVTFMVAMGTSLADGAWGRENAVYRVTGVITVIGGWFLTAIIAFLTSALVLFIIFKGGIIGILFMISIVIFLIINSNKIHKKREEEYTNGFDVKMFNSIEKVDNFINKKIIEFLPQINDIYFHTFQALFAENRKELKRLSKEVDKLNKLTKKNRELSYQIASTLPDEQLVAGDKCVQVFENIREITYCFNYITIPAYYHINNIHKTFNNVQKSELRDIIEKIKEIFNSIIEGISQNKLNKASLNNLINETFTKVQNYRIEQIKRMGENEENYRTDMLYLGFLQETLNVLKNTQNLINIIS